MFCTVGGQDIDHGIPYDRVHRFALRRSGYVLPMTTASRRCCVYRTLTPFKGLAFPRRHIHGVEHIEHCQCPFRFRDATVVEAHLGVSQAFSPGLNVFAVVVFGNSLRE